MKISVIIPTLNEELSLQETLIAISQLKNVSETIVVDGGSSDNTLEIARKADVKIMKTEAGRGLQLDAGAKAAGGDVFWFLHADTLPPNDAGEQILRALRDEKTIGGNFEIRFDGERRAARFLTWLYPKLRILGLCYGDSAFFVRREIYEKSGGFSDLPLFEDVEFYRRLKKRGRFAHLKSFVKSSSRRFEKRSFAFTFARWALFQGLYWAGVSPHFLARHYAHIRK
ncbi:MAG: TIGR04283 family arsenosugar biosynthesis glycosyltransferase [Acidobacteriota bacterium]|nr:TIGR04283 family arsenosugar biosynthesis glycosyltransferase [Acidobacteriota bacterium]